MTTTTKYPTSIDKFCGYCWEWQETYYDVDPETHDADDVTEFCSLCDEDGFLTDSEIEARETARQDADAARGEAMREEW